MMKFYHSGPHAAAMKATSEISSPGGTKVYGYYSDTIPTWDEALLLWDEHGAIHGKKPTKTTTTTTTTTATAAVAKNKVATVPMMVVGSSLGVILVLTVLLGSILQPEWILQTAKATVNNQI